MEFNKRSDSYKNLQAQARAWVDNYLFKHGIKYPTCTISGCDKQAKQKYIPNPSHETRHLVIFVCPEHLQSIINPPSSTKYKVSNRENKIQSLQGDLPEPTNIHEMVKTKDNGRSKNALRQEIRKLIKQHLPHLKNKMCENKSSGEKSKCKSGEDVTYYLRQEKSPFEVSFLCRSCRAKVKHYPEILQKTPTYNVKKMATESIPADALEQNQTNYTLEQANKLLKSELQRWSASYGIAPSPLCAIPQCDYEFPEDKIFSDEVNILFPAGNNPLIVALFCPEHTSMQDNLEMAYQDYYQFKYSSRTSPNKQNLAYFRSPETLLTYHLEEQDRIKREEGY